MKFSELGLHPKVLAAVTETGYTEPTPIQAQAIPHALERRDVLGIAQTGTGKTASFSLPMITLLAQGRARARMPRSLILAPTRELAAQVSENFETYGKHLNLSMALLIGGVSFNEQDKIIDRGVDVLIATPGRLLDHFERGKLMLTGIEIMVVDEADRMLDMGFIDDLERIFKLTPFTRQTLFFSATMPPEITRLTNQFLSNPVRVEVARASSTVDTIDQRLCHVPKARRDRAEREKREALRAILDNEAGTLQNGIIFCNRKRDVSTLFKSLMKHGYDVGALHGDLDQRIRMQVLDGFRNGAVKLLVASDVAARGLDIPSVSHVFNFDVPINAEDYVHRIGRTGRAGRTGVAYTLCAPGDAKLLSRVEELIGKPIPPIALPGVTDAAETDEPAASDAGDDERGERRRGRGGRRRRKGEGEDRAEATHEPARAAPSARSDAASTRGERSRADNGRGRGGRRRRDDRDDAPVVGLGDHVPAFLLREVVFPKPLDEMETHDPEPDADAAAGSDPAAEEPGQKRASKSNGRRKNQGDGGETSRDAA